MPHQPPSCITSSLYCPETVIDVECQKVSKGEAQHLRSNYTLALDNRFPYHPASVLWVVEVLSSAVVALRGASALEAVKEEQRRTWFQARVLSFEAAVTYYLTVAEPVRSAKAPLCWMGGWQGDWLEWMVVHLEGGSLETAGGSLDWLVGHRHYTSAEAAAQVGRTNSAVTAVTAVLMRAAAAALASELTESPMMLPAVA
jgi:hypothetical protein